MDFPPPHLPHGRVQEFRRNTSLNPNSIRNKGKRQRQSNQRPRNGKRLCFCVMAKVVAVLTGLGAILAILYHYGSVPWALTHVRVSYTTTKRFDQTCWTVEPVTIILSKFTGWRRTLPQLDLEVVPEAHRQVQEGGETIPNQTATIITWMTIWEQKSGINETGKEADWAGEFQRVIENSTWRVDDVSTQGEEIKITVMMQKAREEKRAQCNWIYPENGVPSWYCSWACVSWAEQGTKGYWKPEVTYAASHRNDTCLTIMPAEGMFWGHYNLTCEATPPRRKSRRLEVRPSGNTTTGQQYNISSQAMKDTQRETEENVRPTAQEAKEWHPLPEFKPRDISHRKNMSRKLARECTRKKLPQLDKCFWNVFFYCEAQNYFVITPVNKPQYQAQKFIYQPQPNARHEKWLNETLPWIWVTPLTHFRGSFSQGYSRTSHGLLGPRTTDMYVQKLPKPEDLMTAPKGDFQKIDTCVTNKMFNALNGSEYLADGASPRCTLWQEWHRVWGTWQYDCTGLKENQTIKGILQAWKEAHTRDDSSTWWGLQKDEVLDWVVPCLTQTTNYWVKYQYIATVYSKDRDIWPGVWSKPEPYVGPRPWKMECNQGNTTCNISLAGRHCETVPGWTDHCQKHYGNEYETHVQEVTWMKGQDKKWRRTGPVTSSCTNLILGHRMKDRENVNGQIIPPVTDPTVFLAEGHAFRKSLCEGKEDKGFEWIGPNRLYGNGTCYSPEEHWLSCGSGRQEHECTWIELTGASMVGTATMVVEEVAGKIGEGFSIVQGWMGTLFSWLWPYLLMMVGIVILGIVTCAAIKGGVAATVASCFKKNSRKKREVEERPLLRTREGQTHL